MHIQARFLGDHSRLQCWSEHDLKFEAAVDEPSRKTFMNTDIPTCPDREASGS